ncbi:MAG: transglycosylase domain-containing protein [Candidatus Kerfeldbacteria bacterium]|nr:transglycosylase domain-containing protein [Candidatus Kerfeldbacteria bacterium]
MPIQPLRYYNPRQHRWHQRPLRRRPSRRAWWALGWRLVAAAIMCGALLAIGVLAWVSRDLPTPEGIARRIVPQSTKIYDRTGQTVLYDLHGEERRTAIALSDTPAHMLQATLTAEDRNFYQHKGFRFTSMLRAVLADLLGGGKLQGGSTITQQFIKNAIVGGEKSYVRKVKELILAYQIERRFSKDEILKLYFNEIPYGSNAYGVEAAAQTFFGKSVRDLALAESTILAAMVKAPTYYSPWGSHLDELKGRQHYILDAMTEQGYITASEASSAKAAKLTFVPRRENIIAPHFVFYVKELLAAKYGERLVEQGGLKVITTLDLTLQKAAEEAVDQSAKKNLSYKAQNASLVALDVPTGQIVAMVGSRDYFDDEHSGQVNVALRPRQPGSSFKPVVYTEAFNQGFTPDSLLFDVVTTFKTDTKDYTPHDYDSKERGPVSLRQALAGSLNIPAVKLIYLTGISKVLDLADKLGYTTLRDRSRFGLSLVLGGGEVTLLEHTNAYAALAREGVVKPTAAILKVEDSSGATLQEYQDTPGERVIGEQPVRELTGILSDNSARAFIFGSQNSLTLPARPVAAKTGTTNDYHDAWTLGYTPQLAAGVWVGNSNNEAMKRGADGSVVAAPIWQNFMTKATANMPPNAFTPPSPRSASKPMLNGQLGGETVTIDLFSGLRATEFTPPSARLDKVFRQYHTILQYVTPGDLLGPVPSNPSSDPQYKLWEEAVKNWAVSQGYTDEVPPNDYDSLHSAGNKPQVTILQPTINATVQQNPLLAKVEVSSPRGVKQVQYFIDGQKVGESLNPPFGLTLPITSDWPNGYHTLTARAYDDVDNMGEATAPFNLMVTPLPNPYQASFLTPVPNQEITLDKFPLTIEVLVPNPTELKQIDFYTSLPNESSRWLGVATKLENKVSLRWREAEVGDYSLSLTTQDWRGVSHPGPSVNVRVRP